MSFIHLGFLSALKTPFLLCFSKINEKRSSQSLLNDSQIMEINTSMCLKIITAFRQNLYLTDLDPSNYFLNVCKKNLEYYLNQNDNLQISSLFSSKYKEHHLLAVAMSLYLDVCVLDVFSFTPEKIFFFYKWKLRFKLDTSIRLRIGQARKSTRGVSVVETNHRLEDLVSTEFNLHSFASNEEEFQRISRLNMN